MRHLQAEHRFTPGEHGRRGLSRDVQPQQVAVGVMHGQKGHAPIQKQTTNIRLLP